MTRSCGREVLRSHASLQAPLLVRLETAAWQAMRDHGCVDLFDLAARAISGQHGLKASPRPVSLGDSPWTASDVSGWRRREDLSEFDRAGLALAEQVAFNVASTQPDQREAVFAEMGPAAVPFTQAVYAADMLPRARAALDFLFGESDWVEVELAPAGETDGAAELSSAVEDIIRLVPGLQHVDVVTTELVRLLGARRHACRVCQSVRSYSAMEAGADDALFDSVEAYETGEFTPGQKAALAFADGLLASPTRFDSSVAEELTHRFAPEACVELVLDILRNATNKVAVALGGDAPRVESGYEIYDVKPTGEIAYGLEAP